jgi:2-polyprenyl-3-methyl-5-hydroxy-6-metoxy-1,4-benzoquinol methylase
MTVSPSRRTIASYEGSANDYAKLVDPVPPPHTEAALSRLLDAVGPGGSVLEVGSGTGRDADFIESHGARVRRTDATQAFLDLQAARGKQGELLDLLTDDLGGPYDAVLALAVLIHIPRQETRQVLDRIAAALRPGGAFLVSVREGEGETTDDYHTVYWNRGHFAERLLASGLEVVWEAANVGRGGHHWLTFLALSRAAR